VNAISPGVIRTPMHSPEMHGFLAGLQPLGRMGETQEILSAVVCTENLNPSVAVMKSAQEGV
jgi:NAD(P)-dependent dehydrogenase (short-subunit alcohol dehydrogenase family)